MEALSVRRNLFKPDETVRGIGDKLRAFSRRGSLRETLAATYPGYTPSAWMSALAEIYPNRLLRHICVLGSHDAAMYKITHKFFGNEDNAINQNFSVYKQLCKGVRFFDLRPAFARGNIIKRDGLKFVTVTDDRLFSAHMNRWEKSSDLGKLEALVGQELGSIDVRSIYVGATGPPMSEVFADVARFLNERKREIVVLAFRKFHPASIPPPQGSAYKLGDGPLLLQLEQEFSMHLGRFALDPSKASEEDPFNATIGALTEAGSRVLAVTNDASKAKQLRGLGMPIYSRDEFFLDEPYSDEEKHRKKDARKEKRGEWSHFDWTADDQFKRLREELKKRQAERQSHHDKIYRVMQWVVVRKPARGNHSIRQLAQHMNRKAPLRFKTELPKLADHNARQDSRSKQCFPNALMIDAVDEWSSPDGRVKRIGDLWEVTQNVNRELAGLLL